MGLAGHAQTCPPFRDVPSRTRVNVACPGDFGPFPFCVAAIAPSFVIKTSWEETMDSRNTVRLAAVLSAGLSIFGVGSAGADEASEVAAVRAAAEKYKDINIALADGYIPDPAGHCVSAAAEGLPPEWGAMGIHYLNPAALQITASDPRVDGKSTHTDFQKPAILLYEPQADGSLVLVGVENLVFQDAWKAAGNASPPVFAGKTWDTMADDPNTPGDEAHGFAPHYDQHVWAFRDNPSGALMPFNPNVTCEYHKEVAH